MGDQGNGGGGSGMPPGFAIAAAIARRRAMRQTMRPPTIKHGLVKAPHIQHPRDNTGPNFGVGGGFKAGGF
jgi:hypothetical protein